MKPLAIIGIVVYLSPFALGSDVAVRAGDQTGVGILRPHEGSCFVITPLHILGNQYDDIRLTGANGRIGRATLIVQREPDLAVLRVSEDSKELCTTSSWRDNVDVPSLLRNNATGTMTSRTETGSLARFDVSLEDFDSAYVAVTPRNPDRRFVKGYSGSGIEVQGSLVALLVDVDGPRKGRAIRIDRVRALLEDLFTTPNACEDLCESSSARLSKEGNYVGSCDLPVAPTLGITCSRREMVFALPPDWPTHRYLHVVMTRINDLAPNYLMSLSNSKQRGASDLGLFGIARKASGVSNVRSAVCVIEVNADDPDTADFNIQVKSCKYVRPFGQ